MKQFILMNKETGDVCPGVRCSLVDNSIIEHELAKLEGYSVQLRTHDYDGWLIYSGNGNTESETAGPWLYVNRETVEPKIEIIGEL